MLRDLTSIELFNYPEFYAFHTYLKEKAHVFNSENTAFSATASDAALGEGYDRKNPSSRMTVVRREAIRTATSGTFSSLMCMFALSSVTGMQIVSVYPETLGQATKPSQFQNGTISPRMTHNRLTGNDVQKVKLILMWTVDGTLNLPGLDVNFQPNHFVPLVEFNPKAKVECKAPTQQRKITDHFKSPAVDSESYDKSHVKKSTIPPGTEKIKRQPSVKEEDLLGKKTLTIKSGPLQTILESELHYTLIYILLKTHSYI